MVIVLVSSVPRVHSADAGGVSMVRIHIGIRELRRQRRSIPQRRTVIMIGAAVVVIHVRRHRIRRFQIRLYSLLLLLLLLRQSRRRFYAGFRRRWRGRLAGSAFGRGRDVSVALGEILILRRRRWRMVRGGGDRRTRRRVL